MIFFSLLTISFFLATVVLNNYLIFYIDEIIPRIGEIPIGIYSGGPNEQGYNNIELNCNTHNNKNHLPYIPKVTGFKTGSSYSELYEGNLIYEMNSIIFSVESNELKQARLKELIGELMK